MARLACSKPIAAFLDLIAASEGTSTAPNTHDDGYDIIVNGVDGPNSITDYSVHPFATGRKPIIVIPAKPAVYGPISPLAPPPGTLITPAELALESTASGRYQITLPTWKEISSKRGIGTFSPQNQDLTALALLGECGALQHIDAGEIPAAIEAACETWASFPGNTYSQGAHSLAWLQHQYAVSLAAQS